MEINYTKMMRMKRSYSWPSVSEQKQYISMRPKSEEMRTNSASALYQIDQKLFARPDNREIEISSGSSDDDPTLYRIRETSDLFDANSYFLNCIRPLWCNTKTHGSQPQKASSAPAAVSKSSDDSSEFASIELLSKRRCSEEAKRIVVAICAMHRKVKSKPMKEILSRIIEYYGDKMYIIVFNEAMIMNDPVEKWPICDCFISFYSQGFPIAKAIDYIRLRNPYVINDVHRQYDLLSRIKVYKILEKAYIELPRYTVLHREPTSSKTSTYIEHEDSIEIDGKCFNKPFVEKPISAEDHNIYIYYPSCAGGGSQRLFRKVDNRSSIYSPESHIRKEGSYIYEEFMPTDGTDVKVYAVGPDYAHAEARKSPALDGKVDRDSDGKEIRYPVILSSREKLIARKIVWAFRQTVCGFDLLRANGRSYVCDVNGFSFVKTSTRYYDDSALILGNMILRYLAPTLHIPWVRPFQLDDPPLVSTTYGTVMELRCVLGIIRHGDRTPKQKLKMEVSHKKFFDLFSTYDGYKWGELKLKRPAQLQEVLDIVRYLLLQIRDNTDQRRFITEQEAKLEQVKTVLEMHGHFSGINRKVQFKYHKRAKSGPDGLSTDEKSNNDENKCLILIVKWGGELTNAGKIQAEELGRAFRCLYPGGQGKGQSNNDSRGLGFLRLHSTYRHDLKIYASEEGRGLLALEGQLPPILVQMVKSANTDGLLDDDKDARLYQNRVKSFLHSFLQCDADLTEEDFEWLNPTNSITMHNALRFIQNPRQMCIRIHEMIKNIFETIQLRRTKLKNNTLYMGESWDLIERRWGKLVKDFRCVKPNGDVVFDISKIPDIYDCIKYDLEHNASVLLVVEEMEELYLCSKHMADIVVFQEYGITKEEKVLIGKGICTPLIKKLRSDLNRCIDGIVDEENATRLDPRASKDIATPFRHVRTRLYFTSESHIHSLMNLLQFGGLFEYPYDNQWKSALNFLSSVTEYNYMAQLVLMLYEDTTKDARSEDRFHVELHFSPGALPCIQTTHVAGLGYRPKSYRNAMNETLLNINDLIKALDDERVSNKNKLSIDRNKEKQISPTQSSGTSIGVVAIGDKENKPITNEELALHSPDRVPSPDRTLPVIKSSSDISCLKSRYFSHTSCKKKRTSTLGKKNEIEEQPNYYSNIVSVEEPLGARQYPHKRAIYQRQAVKYLWQQDAKLISTAVISGSFSVARDAAPALLSTAVVSRGSSAPDLRLSSRAEELDKSGIDTDIAFMVPPLRSLETLHNQLSLRQIDDFFEAIVASKSPDGKLPENSCEEYLKEEELSQSLLHQIEDVQCEKSLDSYSHGLE
ncbi:Inositol hexakisphosphate and diphosphoinositol-pentakisphosphate kinase [Trichinella pseudospiralis]|uniref:Inositol hexakisphosphate and diphosphoinositol-pentakisphosphate kinase n=1 Tax=Trichinella pseudospiralis TaxID=6337 RepID=A0A0V1J0S9_TRIPS|nr:Inositol hexakisphosphate and diphosphoinositol-pentakisphosphate kinase [Trichinella pseudospiralis]KRZ28197.1 Inositol hexakisphosphate and diphosphoinositol-pentakisphosphate kinase [Trichinella pseudospiralis]